jgi:hypothetical protein
MLLLEYRFGVQADGQQLWWHHKSKNIEQILAGGGQRFKRLRHWQSGTSAINLLKVVKGRLEDVAMMTRADHSGSVGVRGAGNLVRDLALSVLEIVVELVVELGYPVGRLVQMMKGLGRKWYVWSEMVEVLQRFKALWMHEEMMKEAVQMRWADADEDR